MTLFHCLDQENVLLETKVESCRPMNHLKTHSYVEESFMALRTLTKHEYDDYIYWERKMQPARGRFVRSDLDRQMASTFPCPLESGPSSRFLDQPATGTRRVAGTTHTESGRR